MQIQRQSNVILRVLALVALAAAGANLIGAASAQMNPCPYTNDGDCDEPNGLGYCDWGTDTVDCSNPNSKFGTGSGYSANTPSSGSTTASSDDGLHNPCPYTNDGDCDEPNGLNLCAWGTDTADCSNPNSNFGSGSGHGSGAPGSGGNTASSDTGLHNPCPYTNDGDCDEPNGLNFCAWGTDTADCSNPNSNFGSGSGYAGGSTPNTPASGGVPEHQVARAEITQSCVPSPAVITVPAGGNANSFAVRYGSVRFGRNCQYGNALDRGGISITGEWGDPILSISWGRGTEPSEADRMRLVQLTLPAGTYRFYVSGGANALAELSYWVTGP